MKPQRHPTSLLLVLLLTSLCGSLSAATVAVDLPGRVAVTPADAPGSTPMPLSSAGLTTAHLATAGFTNADPRLAIVLTGTRTKVIAIGRPAANLRLLHGLVPGTPISVYRAADQAVRMVGDQPVERPIVSTMTVVYADGVELTVALRYQEAIGALIRPWWHPVEGFPGDMADANLVWQAPLPSDGRLIAVLHAMTWPNPRPTVTISSVRLTGSVGLGDGSHLIYGMATDDNVWAGTTYVVAPNGNDSDPGSLDRPWATLGKAASTIVAGDRVFVRGGIYRPTARIAFRNLKAPEGRRTLVTAWPGEIVIFDFIDALWDESPTRVQLGFEVYPHDQSMIHSHQCERFTVRNLTVIRSRARGLGSENGKWNEIAHCTVYKTFGPGIRIAGVAYRVTGCRVVRPTSRTMAPDGHGGVGGFVDTDGVVRYLDRNGVATDICPMEGVDVGSSSGGSHLDQNEIAWGDKECMLLDGTISDMLVDKNYAHDALKPPHIWGIAPNGYGPQTRIEVSGNIAHNVGFAFGVGTEGGNGESTDIRVHHNIAWDCKWGLASVTASLGSGGTIRRCSVYNNSYHCTTGTVYSHWSSGIVVSYPKSTQNGLIEDLTIANNLIWNLGNISSSWDGGQTITINTNIQRFTADRNVVANNLANVWRTSGGSITGAPCFFTTTPQYTDPTNWCFNLRPGSLAIGNGVGIGANGATNTVDPATDIGAVPYGAPRGAFTNPVLRIVCIGDSITQGGRTNREEYTYRWPLFQWFVDSGRPFDFIGSRTQGLHADAVWPDYLDVPFDRDHEGYYGNTTAQVLSKLPRAIASWNAAPDIALIDLGTNDQNATNHDVAVAQPLRRMVALLRQQNPRMTILLGHLFYTSGNALVIRTLVDALATELDTPVSRVATVAHYQGFIADPSDPDTDTFDWAHPTLKGQRKMSDAWLGVLRQVGALENALPAPPTYSWQLPQCQITSTGDIEWQPQAFVYETGPTVRCIDFEAGNDSNDGSRSAPWKHHPWDANATGNAAAFTGTCTYVFKRGVVYRGTLTADESGAVGNPIRLTSDPSWGSGEAVLCGSDRVTGTWQRASSSINPDLPTPTNVWYMSLASGWTPRCLWQVKGDGTILRLPLARVPNWRESNPEDVKSELWELPVDGGYGPIPGSSPIKNDNTFTDPVRIVQPAAYYTNATVWIEFAGNMCGTYPAPVDYVDVTSNRVYHGGLWGQGDASYKSVAGNRYYFENKPHYLDENGEWYYSASGADARNLYLRLPDGGDPNTAMIEAGSRTVMIQLVGNSNIVVSGLTFRFTNVDGVSTRWVRNGCIRADQKTAVNLTIKNCRFEHVNKALMLRTTSLTTPQDGIRFTDNEIVEADHAGLEIFNEYAYGALGSVEILRNKFYRCGFRREKGMWGHVMHVTFPVTIEVAGNVLDRSYGSGIHLFGGKPSGTLSADAPFSRMLVHHNKSTAALLNTCDWGSIETWQGGPAYVYGNISGNPNGYIHYHEHNSTLWPNNPFTQTRYCGAYYLDGAFKNYLFNNVAWGINNTLSNSLCSSMAVQHVMGILNSFANNTFYKFGAVSGWFLNNGAYRVTWLNNLAIDTSDVNFWYNRADRLNGSSVAFGANGFVGNPNRFSTWFGTSTNLAAFNTQLTNNKTMLYDAGDMLPTIPVLNPGAHDFRLKPGAPGIDAGSRTFVPWSLYGNVGEWHFVRNNSDPAVLFDEHWYMDKTYGVRDDYHLLPRHEMRGINIVSGNYETGVLENWTAGALRLNGADQYAVVYDASLKSDVTYTNSGGTPVVLPAADRRTPDMDSNNFLIEVFFKTTPGHTNGVIVSKVSTTGYVLKLNGAGQARMEMWTGGAVACSRESTATVNNGVWHHVVAEINRGDPLGVSIYVDGASSQQFFSGAMPATNVSLSNTADFLVGKGPTGNHFAGSLDFLRVARGTLADAKTTIEELHAWEFDGPFLRDFMGRLPEGARDIGAFEYIDPYNLWAAGYNLTEASTGDDDQDGLCNLLEYALHGNPTNSADTGYVSYGVEETGGTNCLNYVYARRITPGGGLYYALEVTTNLVEGVWTNGGYVTLPAGRIDDDFEVVTNRISVDDGAQEFIRLRIEHTFSTP